MPERYRVLWTRAAVVDLDLIVEHVAADAGVERALALYERIRDRIDSLSGLPRRQRVVPELEHIAVREFRELLTGHYRIVFRLDGSKVVLVGVLDGRRDLEAILIDRALRV